MPEDNATSEPGFVYALADATTSEIRYVGKTLESVEQRLTRHIWAAKNGGRLYVHNWIRSVDYQISISILETIARGANIDEAERRWIAAFRKNGTKLTNIREGGGGGRFKLTEPLRDKIAAANRRRFSDPKARERISECNRNRTIQTRVVRLSPETIERIAAANRRPKTDAEKAAMSAAHRKRLQDPKQREILIGQLRRIRDLPLSDATREKIGAATRGIPKSDLVREHMRQAWVVRKQMGRVSSRKGVPRSEETRRRMKEGWALRKQKLAST